jgi:hypothetical protein
MVNKLAENNGKSLPQTFSNSGDLRGAYRFFDNDLVTPEKIIEPHSIETIARCKHQDVILAIQDSSDLDFDYMESLEGFESLHPSVEKGFRIHPVLATTEKGTPLGVLAAFNYTRTEISTKKHRNSLPIEQKESFRWLQGYREACKLIAQTKAQVISIADREGDIYECLLEATDCKIENKADILVRAQHNRALKETNDDINKIEKKLIRSAVAYNAKIELNKHRKNARKADIVVRACEIVLKAPQTNMKKELAPVIINAVLVIEADPPKGVEPLHWLLITTLPIDTPEQIRRIVRLYSQRWSIEIYFKILKSGCSIDSRYFQTTTHIENYIAVSMLVAWKVMLTTYLPREFPNAPCSILFTEVEWRLAFRRVYKTKPFPKSPSLKDAVSFVAMLGGYQKRKEPPGIQTIWHGVTRLMDMVYGYELTQEVILSQK